MAGCGHLGSLSLAFFPTASLVLLWTETCACLRHFLPTFSIRSLDSNIPCPPSPYSLIPTPLSSLVSPSICLVYEIFA